MKVNRFKKLMAVALTTALSVTSLAPATVENVQAEAIATENPFAQNVAKGKKVTVNVTEGYSSNEEEAGKLVDGTIEGQSWEPQRLSNPEIVVDLEEEYILDKVSLYWRDTYLANSYEVYISSDSTEWTLVGEEENMPTTSNDCGVAETRQMDYTFLPQTVQYIKLVCTESDSGAYCLREIAAYSIGTIEESMKLEYALDKEIVSASSIRVEGDDRGPANNINDGKINTLWQSHGEDGDKEYICIDLGKTQVINQVAVNWNLDTVASEYTIDVATEDDAVSTSNIDKVGANGWTTIVKQNTPKNLDETKTEMISNLDKAVEARYVKLTGTVKGNYGISVKELEANYIKDSIEADSIYLSKSNVILSEVGDTVTLYSQVLPANAEGCEVIWDSDDDNVATVDDKGVVKATGNGRTTITATVNGKYKASCKVRVAAQLEKPVVTATKAENNAIQVSWNTIEHADAYEIQRSSNAEPYTVLETVKTTSYVDNKVEEGKFYWYKVKALDSKEVYVDSEFSEETTEILVPLGIKSVSLNAIEEDLVVGDEEKTLRVILYPENANVKSIVWKTNNQNVADVIQNRGNISANIRPISAGKTDITVTVTDMHGNTESASCTVNVKSKLSAPTVSAEKTGDYEIKVTWNVVEDAVAYDVYRAAGKDGTFELCKESVEKNEYVDTINSATVGNTYRYQVVAKAASDDKNYSGGVMSAASNKVQIGEVSPFGLNVAEGAKVTASSVDGERGEEYIVDGDTTSAINWWESVKGNEQESILLDLKDVYKIDRIKVYWNNLIPAKDYTILAGSTKEDLKTIKIYKKEETDITNFTTDCILDNAEDVRYVQVIMDEPLNYDCFGIFEIEVYTQGTVETEDAVLSDVVISKESIQLEKGKCFDLFAQKLPINASEEMEWITSDESIATVVDGKVTAVAVGDATITAKAGSVSANCAVMVTEQLDAPTSVSANLINDMSNIEITWGSVDKADAYKILRKEGDKDYTELATVTNTSYLDTTVEEGNNYAYTIKAVCDNKYYLESNHSKATGRIAIPIRVDEVSLNETETTVFVGESIELTAIIAPANADNQEVTWDSEEESVATVVNGMVTANAIGTTKIIVTTKDGAKSAECVVTVVQKLDTPVVRAEKAEDDSMITLTWDTIENAKDYTIYRSVDGEKSESVGTVNQKATGTIVYEDAEIREGSTYTYTVIANSASEYYVESEESEVTDEIVVPIHAKSVSLNTTEAELVVGEEITLTATVIPENAVNKNVTWETSKPDVVSVVDGVVKALAVGEATITVKTEDGNKTAECEITVKAVPVEPEQKPGDGQNETQKPHTHTWSEVQVIKDATTTETGLKGQRCTGCGEVNPDTQEVMPKYTVKLNAKSAPLQVKKSTKAIKATVLDGDKIVKWSSSNEKIATVTSKGVIKAKNKTGTVKITATSAKGAKATITIKVQKGIVKTTKVAVTNVKKNKLTLETGKKFTLDVSLTPITSPDKVKYTTSNKKVVTVTKNGVLTAKKKGKAKITVMSGNKKKVITVTVK